jgi:oxygen-independent coproporphyrinogen-3 oxidase
VSEYTDAIMAEMVTRGIRSLESPVRTIYFGGGTPSKLGGEGVGRVIHIMADLMGVDKFSTSTSDIEITVEANPEDVTVEVAQSWVAAGVNRVSLGVQTFSPAVLAWMHRGHGPDRSFEAVRILRSAGVQEISADLIFAVPESLERSWTEDIARVTELDVDHISIYGLTVESGTPLGRWTARGEVAESPEERYEAEFLEAHERLTGAGFEHYEVSNYAKPGRRARHNSAYWAGVPYLGLGPSAHGFDGRERRWNVSAYTEWLRRVQGGDDPIEGSEYPGATAASLSAERVYLGLRTSDGLQLRGEEIPRVAPWVAAGWARMQGEDRVVLSPQGWLRLDALAAALL